MKDLTLKNAKEKYEQIKASDKLKMEVNNMFNEKRNNVLKTTGNVAAAAVIAFAVGLNASPVFASNLAKNEMLRPIITVLTMNRFNFSENNMYVEVVTPVIKVEANKTTEERINEEIKRMSDRLIVEFTADAEDLKEFDETAHLGIESNYFIKTDNDKVLSVDIYVVNTVASSSTIHRFYNVDKVTGEEIKLADRFKGNENYLEDICRFIEHEMTKQNLEYEGTYYASYKDILDIVTEKQSFYINEKGNVVIVFDKYEVGPGSSGCPEFEIIL